MKHEQVVVGKFISEIDAEIAKGHLGSEGIKASIIKSNIGGTFPSLQYSDGVQLSVDETDAKKARLVIKAKLTRPKR